MHISGVVVVGATITARGDVADLSIVSGPPMLQQAAMTAVQQWKYTPYRVNGAPTSIHTTISVSFTLDDGPPAAQPAATGAAQPTAPAAAKPTAQPAPEAASSSALNAKAKELYSQKKFAEALATYQQAAAQGDRESQFIMAEMYLGGEGTEENDAQGFAILMKLALQGDPKAEVRVGQLVSVGAGTTRDPDQGVAWFRKAADQGYGPAMFNIGATYESGPAKSSTEAAFWYKKGANLGDPQSMISLGYDYLNGQGVPRDPAQAHAWYEKAANLGDINAKYRLARLNANTDWEAAHPGVPDPSSDGQLELGTAEHWAKQLFDQKNYADALGVLEEAASLGSAYSKNQLGWMYQNGLGVQQDYSQAVSWYQNGATQGFAMSQNNLGYMYLNGLGVQRDPSQARVLFQKAADQGLPNAKNLLAQMDAAAAPPPQQMAQAQPAQDSQSDADDIASQIDDLQSDIEMHQQGAADWDDAAAKAMDTSMCSGASLPICQGIAQMGAAKARANANKERNAIADDQAEIRRLQGERNATAQHLDASFGGNLHPIVQPGQQTAVTVYNQTSQPSGQSTTASVGSVVAAQNGCVGVTSDGKYMHVRNNCSYQIELTFITQSGGFYAAPTGANAEIPHLFFIEAYKYFACPYRAWIEESGTKQAVTYNTTSFECVMTNSSM